MFIIYLGFEFVTQVDGSCTSHSWQLVQVSFASIYCKYRNQLRWLSVDQQNVDDRGQFKTTTNGITFFTWLKYSTVWQDPDNCKQDSSGLYYATRIPTTIEDYVDGARAPGQIQEKENNNNNTSNSPKLKMINITRWF